MVQRSGSDIHIGRKDIDQLFFSDEKQFVENCYRTLLKRGLDSEGAQHYGGLLADGKSRRAIILDILGSKEARSRLENIDQTKRYVRYRPFYHFFRPDLDERIAGVGDQVTRLVEAIKQLESEGASKAKKKILTEKYEDVLRYAVRVRGGLGDALIIARFIRDLQVLFGEKLSFDVFFHSPDVVRFVYLNISGFGEIYGEESYHDSRHNYAFSLDCNQYVSFDREVLDWSEINQFPEESRIIHRVYKCMLLKRHECYLYIDNLPYLDGAFANREIFRGHVRYKYLHYMAGIEYGGDQFKLILPNLPTELQGKKYFVVHDGWDNAFELDTNRPTKAVPFEFWKLFVEKLKSKYPDHLIVQVGGAKGEDIPGVDINYRKRIGFAKAVSVLSGATMHIDSESGLVHFASALGVKSVVLFGPTNQTWFGYSQNINIPPTACGNCWWSTKDWMDHCPAGHIDPVCTMHRAEEVCNEISKAP